MINSNRKTRWMSRFTAETREVPLFHREGSGKIFPYQQRSGEVAVSGNALEVAPGCLQRAVPLMSFKQRFGLVRHQANASSLSIEGRAERQLSRKRHRSIACGQGFSRSAGAGGDGDLPCARRRSPARRLKVRQGDPMGIDKKPASMHANIALIVSKCVQQNPAVASVNKPK
ncbi:hypothetical protein [Pseudomonas sp. Pseusp97]|uniref:hypothetical protein n=1 Tax=Pseudomonas sp. Pseusp97 TaxID=3243065 RepID=UPI0039A51394